MKFKDLMKLSYDKNSGCIEKEILINGLPNTPYEIIEQVYSDHGRNSDFQKQYADIDISMICWDLKLLSALEISECNYFKELVNWFESVSKRAEMFNSQGWNCIDTRPEIREYWRKNKTWVIPPVLFDNSIFEMKSNIYLVEGHTRVALLKGLISSKIISKEDNHKVWLGSKRSDSF